MLWMRNELREFVQDSLTEERLRRRGIFHPAAVATMVQKHIAGTIDASNRIFVLLMLELWFQRFVDGRSELYQSGGHDGAKP
jgi:asparagine synthase (glutamine-hydrolysing)